MISFVLGQSKQMPHIGAAQLQQGFAHDHCFASG
ncbi:hypothetical protein CTATCC11996_08450 [Comamonas testosteroni ATCC 11996]|nr:hypothetical protein CTATCC11996_08450 [Comamonas testosteroni ATCC 11996]